MSNLTPETPAPAPSRDITPLLGQLRQLITDARTRALHAVDSIQVRTCWEVGRHIVEFEQGGQARAEYGKRLLPMLAGQLTQEFGKGFDASNLCYMRLFYRAFPKCDALRHELSWTHYRLLTWVESAAARDFCGNGGYSKSPKGSPRPRRAGVRGWGNLPRKIPNLPLHPPLNPLPSREGKFVISPRQGRFNSVGKT